MKKIILFLCALCALVTGLSAKPACPYALTLTQPDGTQLTAYLHGDAFFHYYTDTEGNMLKCDQDGYYKSVPMPSADEMKALIQQSPRRAARQEMIGGELNLAPRGLIILVSFSDLAFTTPTQEIDSMLNGQNYTRRYTGYTYTGKKTTITSEGSARQYFQDNSLGQYNPVFDIAGPVTISNGYTYYGRNDSHGDDDHPDEMIKEACQLVDDEVDFSIYDNDNDGSVDFVYILYAGYGEADGGSTNTIWPHNYKLSYTGMSFKIDGKWVNNYACSCELSYQSKQHDGIGTFCHEFSHVLGLPDLYVTNGGTHKTVGSWDILDAGPYNNDGNTPPNYSAYERFYMGWLTPTIINKACDVTLPALGDAACAALLTTSGAHNLSGLNPNPSTFYILENRQKKGWDAYLPGHGMLVTKINYSYGKWAANSVNNTQTAMGVDIIEADGKTPMYGQTGYEGKAGDAYPAGAHTFTSVAAYKVTDIREENGMIYFLVNGGGDPLVLDVEDTEQPSVPVTRKIIRDGKILIDHNGIYYDLLGNRR